MLDSADSEAYRPHVWVIEKADTREWLGTHDRSSMGGLEFGGRVPLFYQSLKVTKEAWLRHCCALGYLTRNITLAGGAPSYRTGPNYQLKPIVRFRRLELVSIAVATEE